MSIAVYKIDPLQDCRWSEFLNKHHGASVFHTTAWLQALKRTYGYEPVIFTTSPPETELRNGIPFCGIKTWLTGRRLVSLPFSDHCAPLVESSTELNHIMRSLQREVAEKEWNYVEIRAGDLHLPSDVIFEKAKAYSFHKLDLRPNLDELFRGFHKDCVQRKIHRAEREGLTYEEGSEDSLLRKFYHLLLITRRRHGLAPQPFRWFRNLIACLGDRVKIRVASKGGRPVASILTLRHQRTLVYKYGCSDHRFNNLGGTQLLMWRAIQEAKSDGLDELDMGRSDCDNPGLIAFKDRWRAARSTLSYLRHPLRYSQTISGVMPGNVAKYIFAHAPDSLLAATGNMLYKYMG
ncbi:MAG TPA: GNAT family N-acetyltransferase [Terriglobales bacterium]|nr:GNAT family N-acetyltransferase [Terriglobales bacterium]